MTAPIPLTHGYNDYGRYAATSDITLLNQQGVNYTALTTYPVIFTAQLTHIFVIATVSVARLRVSLRWTPDAASVGPAVTDEIVCKANDLAEVPIPVKGHYLQVTVELSAYPNTASVQIISIPGNYNVVTPVGRNTLISVDGVNLAGVTTVTHDAVYVRAGWMEWNAVLDLGISWRAKLYAMNFDGTFTLLDMVDHNAPKHNRIVLVPPHPIRIEMFNADGGAHSTYITAIFHPHHT